MQMCLDRLFLEAEEERVEQENRERQQAEQVAAGVIIWDSIVTLYEACVPVSPQEENMHLITIK